jgi:hypothetical protein
MSTALLGHEHISQHCLGKVHRLISAAGDMNSTLQNRIPTLWVYDHTFSTPASVNLALDCNQSYPQFIPCLTSTFRGRDVDAALNENTVLGEELLSLVLVDIHVYHSAERRSVFQCRDEAITR